MASVHGDLKQLEKALNKNINQVEVLDADGCSPLFLACREGHVELIPPLLKAEANPNTPNKHGCTPLHVACELGDVEVVRLLLRNKADWTICDSKGRSALLIAAGLGHAKVVEALLAAGAEVDVGVKHNPGCTSLQLSAEKGHAAVVSVLLAGGANSLAKDDRGCTPLHAGTNQSSSLHTYPLHSALCYQWTSFHHHVHHLCYL